ncbi:hypothetical protein SAY87_017579 [Trapa incisa]|uniref:Uncharacterized protein n=1 Tax=Trapa incisa TaxID=236973 RepID=A0AAN7QT28_9MYRT|nr:hypothetical protein SAY87_017579 [Trapa incisa]
MRSPLLASLQLTQQGKEESMEVVDRCQIFMPPDSAPPSTITLSFLDLPWFFLTSPAQRVLFYSLPAGYTLLEFTGTALPSLKNSLSLALERFYPLSGNLAGALPRERPHILCSKDSSVAFTAAVSAADFDEITSDSPQDASLLHPLVPPLGDPVVKDGTRLAPLLSVQLNRKFQSSNRQCKSPWSSIGDIVSEQGDKHRTGNPSPNPIPSQPGDEVYRATFAVSRDHIDRLKSWILKQSEEQLLRVSTFVAICAYAWVCLVKSMEAEKVTGSSNTDPVYGFVFSVDCRGRLGDDLVGRQGILLAARAIGAKVKELGEEGGPLRALERLYVEVDEMAGTPRQRLYDTDFGWGRPWKSVLASTDMNGSISLGESKEGDDA